MTGLSDAVMRAFLSRSIASNRKIGILNQNKLNGLLAEVDFRRHMAREGYDKQVSLGGWVARRVGPGHFGESTVAIFPEILDSGELLTTNRPLSPPSHGLHTICATFHQIGIASFFCAARVVRENDVGGLSWEAVRLGVPVQQDPAPLSRVLENLLSRRSRRHNFMSYKTDVSRIPRHCLAEEFLKEHIRVSLQSEFLAEVSDIDGIFWGNQFTYPLEIKEKTAATDRNLGEYFGLDVGPFVKLAFYAAKRGNLHSLFVVREITDVVSRDLKGWWYITFDKLAQYASWNQQGGGRNMLGGASTVVKIPKQQFKALTASELALL